MVMIKEDDTPALLQNAEPLIKRLKKRSKLKTLAQSQTYQNQIRRCIIAFNDAQHALDIADARLAECRLDRDDRTEVNRIIGERIGVDHALSEMRLRILASEDYCSFLASTLSDVTGVQARRGRGRPSSTYVSEAKELIDFFEKVTGKHAGFPKQSVEKKKGQQRKQKIRYNNPAAPSFQGSTEFVRQALQQIDPKITLAKTISSIRSALK